MRKHLEVRQRHVGPTGVEPDDIRAFITSQLEPPAAAHNRYRGLSRFFNWLVEQEYLDGSPMARLKPPRLEEKVVEVIQEEDVRTLFKSLAGKTFEDRRDRAIISILYDTGMRLSEIAGLRWIPGDETVNDVDLEWGQLRVLGNDGHKPGSHHGFSACLPTGQD